LKRRKDYLCSYNIIKILQQLVLNSFLNFFQIFLGERLRQSLESINKDLKPAQRKVVINALEEHIKYKGYIHCYRAMHDRIIPYDVYYRLRREESGMNSGINNIIVS
jgi:hypothetical protein